MGWQDNNAKIGRWAYHRPRISWEVMNPKSDATCFSGQSERECKEWLLGTLKRHPDSWVKDYPRWQDWEGGNRGEMQMCEYCEKDKTMLSQKIISRSNWGWGYDNLIKLTLTEAEEDSVKLAVFIDRGYLRLVDIGDCNCMDAGENIKIKFCPLCGETLKEG